MSVQVKELKSKKLYQINDKFVMYHKPTALWVCNDELTPAESKAWKDYKKGITAEP